VRARAQGRPARVALTVAAIAAVAAAFAAVVLGSSSSPPERAPAAPAPAGPRAAFRIPRPEPLRTAGETRWATVERPVAARSRAAGGRRIARLSSRTPEGTQNLVVVVGRTRNAGGALWVRVRLPVLPNNTTGWVPRASLGGYHTVDTRLVVDRRKLTAELFRSGRRIFRARVGVGQDRWPTPAGRFYVRVKLTTYKSPFYGPLAFGTSARSAVLTDWPAGGFVGIHGTDQPELLPGRVSHGCIRMRNDAILRLGELMPVGTPVTVT
jgi:hypothetical protein